MVKYIGPLTFIIKKHLRMTLHIRNDGGYHIIIRSVSHFHIKDKITASHRIFVFNSTWITPAKRDTYIHQKNKVQNDKCLIFIRTIKSEKVHTKAKPRLL